VLDLREVSHLDYSGVPELVARRREMVARGGDLLIAVRNPYVSNILKAAGGSELALFRSVEEASSAVAAPVVRARMMRK
jgi:anti-anti-sigma regulatory factor